MLLIYGQSFSSSENGPEWEVPFQFRNWFEISDGQAFSSSENGPDRTAIFVMEMVRWIVDVPQTAIPLVVNIGNGLGQSLFLTVTLSSGQEDWSASPDNHSFEAHSCEKF